MTALEDPRWLALSKERRDALLEKHRDANVFDEWWDSVYGMFVEDCAEKGIEVDTHTSRTVGGKQAQRRSIYFSGFWSQGDGACFDGRVNDWIKFFEAMKRPDLVTLYQKTDEPLTLAWSHEGRYYHANCVSFSSELCLDNPHDDDEDPLLHAAWNIAYEEGYVFDKLEETFAEFVRDLMCDLYKSLEEEHDYLTSDEAIAEYILDHCEEELVEEDDEEECSLEH